MLEKETPFYLPWSIECLKLIKRKKNKNNNKIEWTIALIMKIGPHHIDRLHSNSYTRLILFIILERQGVWEWKWTRERTRETKTWTYISKIRQKSWFFLSLIDDFNYTFFFFVKKFDRKWKFMLIKLPLAWTIFFWELLLGVPQIWGVSYTEVREFNC